MKKLLPIFFLIPFFTSAQSDYFNFGFEDSDTAGKKIISVNYICYKTIVEIERNSEISFSGNNCLCLNTHNNNDYEGCTIYISLPKEFCKDLRHVEVTLKSRYQSDYKNGGFWVFATKGNKYLGKATTYPGYFPFPIIYSFMWKPRKFPVFPYEWYSDKLEFNIGEDPDELLLGFYVRYGRIWYDDIQVTLNDKPVNNLVFKFSK